MTPQGFLTLGDVRKSVAKIRREYSRDGGAPEDWHAAEDALYVQVLQDIAACCDDSYSAELAKEALKVRDMEFSRWYA